MNEASPIPTAESLGEEANGDAVLGVRERAGLYFAVGLGAGAVIALQIDIMRVFSVGSWAHFGSLVVSLAMLGFGLTSAVMTVAKDWFSRHWRGSRDRRARIVRAARCRRQSLRRSGSASTRSFSSRTPRRNGSSWRCSSRS